MPHNKPRKKHRYKMCKKKKNVLGNTGKEQPPLPLALDSLLLSFLALRSSNSFFHGLHVTAA